MKVRRRKRIIRPLMPHQEDALRYALKTSHPGFLMEMRLGKTLTSIRWLQRIGARSIIVIAPITVLEAWERELTTEGERYVNAYGLTPAKRLDAIRDVYESRQRKFLLINYEAVTNTEILRKLDWDAVLIDESRRLGNPSNSITKACLSGFRRCSHRTILTGLPNPESDLELICQMIFLHGHFMGYKSFWQARNVLFFKGNDGYSWFHKKGSRKRIKEYIHSLCYVLTRHDAGMPEEFVYQVRSIPMTAQQKKLYQQIEKEYAYETSSGRVETKWVLTKEYWLSRIVGGFDPELNLLSRSKAEEVLNVLKEIDGKSVVWFRYVEELRLVASILKEKRIPFVEIHGEVPYPERKARIQAFRNKARVLLATEKCAKYGVDCSCASTAIYYSNEWSADDRNQSKDRIYHPKKGSEPLLVIDLVTKGTIDEDVVEALKDKTLEHRLFMSRIWSGAIRRHGKL